MNHRPTRSWWADARAVAEALEGVPRTGGAQRRRSRGVALLMVLLMVSIMGAYATQFSYDTRVSLHIATNVEQQVQAYYHARSAIEIATLVIKARSLIAKVAGALGVRGANIQVWPYACRFAEIYNTGKLDLFGKELLDLSDQPGIGVSKGGFECTADAEDGKLNVNFIETPQAQRTLVRHLFNLLQGPHPEGVGLTREDRDKLETVLNIIDWVDPDDVRLDLDQNLNPVPAGGPEDALYSDVDYEPKNAKFDSVDEVRLVEGMDDETFCQLRNRITVYSTEKINVNSADLDLLVALLCEYMTPQAQAVLCTGGLGDVALVQVAGLIEQCRNLRKALFMPFSARSFLQFLRGLGSMAGIDLQLRERELQQVLGESSRVIRIEATGTMGNTERHITAIIDTGTGKTVYWREE